MTNTIFAFMNAGATELVGLRTMDQNGNWSEVDGEAASTEAFNVVGVLAGNDVSCWPVELPDISRSKQLRILPSILEDQLGARSGREHYALAQIEKFDSSLEYVAFCVSSAVMRQAIAALQTRGLEPKALVPDYVLLPVPGSELELNVWHANGSTVAVRCADGSGYGVEPELFELVKGDTQVAELDAANFASDEFIKTSLLQGEFEPRTGFLNQSRVLRRFASIAAVAVLVAGVWFHVETYRMNTLSDQFEQDTEAVFRAAFPEIARVVDPVSQGRRAIATLRQDSGGAFLRISEQVFKTVQEHPGVVLRGVRFNQQQGGYFLSVSAPSFSAGEAFRQALSATGLNVTEGGSRQEEGSIVSDLAIEVRS